MSSSLSLVSLQHPVEFAKDEAYQVFLKQVSVDNPQVHALLQKMSVRGLVKALLSKDPTGIKLSNLFKYIISIPDWAISPELSHLAHDIDSLFSRAEAKSYSRQARMIYQDVKPFYDKKQVYEHTKVTRGYLNLPLEILTGCAKYAVQVGNGSLFSENNLAFFQTCKKFRALRNDVFMGNSPAVFDIFMRAQYRLPHIPRGFQQLLQNIGPSITTLPFRIRDDFTSVLTLFPNLDEVRFSARPATQGNVSLIEKLNSGTCWSVSLTSKARARLSDRRLKVLELQSEDFTHRQMQLVLGNSRQSLREIALHGCALNDATLQYLGDNHPNLEKVSLSICSEGITQNGFSALAKLVHLKSLSVIDEDGILSYPTHSAAQIATSCTQLESLELTFHSQESVNSVLPHLEHLKKLSTLRIVSTERQGSFMDDHLSTIAKIATLTALEIWCHSEVSQERLQELGRLSLLREFGCFIIPLRARAPLPLHTLLPCFPNLQKFTAADEHLTGEVVQALGSLRQLRELELALDDDYFDPSEPALKKLIPILRTVKPQNLSLQCSLSSPLSVVTPMLTSCESLRQLRIFSSGRDGRDLHAERWIWKDVKKLQRDFPKVQLVCNREPVFAKTYVQEELPPEERKEVDSDESDDDVVDLTHQTERSKCSVM